MAIDFNKILTKQASAIEKPKPLPIGTYLCNNPQLPKFVGVGKNETPCAEFGLVVLSAGEDVDTDDLATFGKYQGKSIRHRIFLTEATEFRAKEELIEKFGIEEGDKTLGQLFNETINKQVYVKIKHRPSDDGTEMYSEVEELLPA